MKILILIAFSLFMQSCTNIDLVHFANNFEVIAKTKNEIPTLSSRILKIRDFGECENSICPSEVLYITVSEFGEYPKQKLYITPKANEWSFEGWKHIPKLGEDNPSLIVGLKSINNKKVKYFNVKVNLERIAFNEVKR